MNGLDGFTDDDTALGWVTVLWDVSGDGRESPDDDDPISSSAEDGDGWLFDLLSEARPHHARCARWTSLPIAQAQRMSSLAMATLITLMFLEASRLRRS